MLAVVIPFLASAKKDGKDVHAHRVRLHFFFFSFAFLGVSGTELLTKPKQVLNVCVATYMNHSGWEGMREDKARLMNEELVCFAPNVCQYNFNFLCRNDLWKFIL